ncbi:hypothetical protein SAMN06296241_2076 [Salinimicrobium sediminis]|uniref:Uncharacterized protein n=1 Tax=Salinimicrobium sediminis TaxID=1343891 RepID=A0A285X6W3_9FLAO|nr:hypothetical protein SAMN06296241_2076 [Salinimicrobium sediminis]
MQFQEYILDFILGMQSRLEKNKAKNWGNIFLKITYRNLKRFYNEDLMKKSEPFLDSPAQ